MFLYFSNSFFYLSLSFRGLLLSISKIASNSEINSQSFDVAMAEAALSLAFL